MSLIRAIANPRLAYQKARQHGIGRAVIHQLTKFPGPVAHNLVGLIRLGKIAANPAGFMRRKYLGAKLARNSAYRAFFPEDKAYRVAPPGTFEAVDAIIPVARKVYRKFLAAHPNGRANDSAYSYLLCDFENGPANGEITDLTGYPEFQDLALYRPFVEMASQYLGEVPILSSVLLQVVWPNESTEGFQRFHIDRIDRRQFKIFIAIEDVDEGNGATIIIPADVSDALARSIGHYYGRIPDDVVYSDRWRPHLTHAAGPAGTAFMFDTCRVVHCGARTRTKPRVIIQLQYVSKYCHAEGPAQLGKVIFDTSRARDAIDRLLLSA